MKIELATDENTKNIFIVDGVTITEQMGYITGKDNKNLWARVYDYRLSLKASEVTFYEIPKEITSLTLNYPLEFNDFIDEISVTRDRSNYENMELCFNFSWDFEKWKKPFSIEEFAEAMEYTAAQYKNQYVRWVQQDEVISNGCHISCANFSKDESIASVIEQYIPIIEEIYQNANKSLIEKSREESMVSLFHFPEQVRVACEQYLLYFAEFLKDIGIKATTDISHEASQVIFSVTPESSEIALTKIREALNVYLQLPINLSNLNFVNMTVGPREQQLLANIQHLNGQLLLSNALVQAQKEIIENQRLTIDQQHRIIDSSILQQSLLKDSNSNEDQEEILAGTVSLTKYKGNGFEINTPGIYRWIKEKLLKQ
ncbi:hypothetical protein D3C74_262700 [compost metagenome]